MPRSTVGRVQCRPMQYRPSSSTQISIGLDTSSVLTSCLISFTAMLCGGSRETPLTCRRIAHSETNASAGQATSLCSLPLRRISLASRTFWLIGFRISTSSRTAPAVSCPWLSRALRRMEGLTVFTHGPYAIWGDASIWVPWALWQAYGDLRILESQFESMVAHLHQVVGKLSPSGLWDQGFQFGDWLDPDAPPDQPWASKANSGVVATACLYRSARTVVDVARLLGQEERAEEFQTLAQQHSDCLYCPRTSGPMGGSRAMLRLCTPLPSLLV